MRFTDFFHQGEPVLRKSDRSYSNEQYKAFIRGLLEGGLLGFFLEYPVLARLVATITDFWIDSNAEFILRLASDWVQIEKTFHPYTKLGKVIAVEPDLSDPHHSGRFVMMVTFASGFKLVYKPRNIDIEKAYLNLLVWFNKQSISLDFKLFKLISKDKYGWVEFVEASYCKNQEEARRYYQRSGILLCLMHVLGATDLHYENIIACGEYPVLIDMETLMHPYIKEVGEINTANKIQYLVHQKILHSVLRTGLLPQWQFTSIDQSYDLSGLGGGVKQKTFFRVPKWLDINTDNMLMSYEYDAIGKNTNMSSWDRDELALNNYQEEIVEGFRYMYIFLMKHQATILALDNPFTTLAHQSVRFIFRPTKTYSFLLKITLDPKFLRDGADRSIQFDLLSRVMLLSNKKPIFWPLLGVEKQALEQMDTPIFTTYSDSDGFTINPHQTIRKCFIESGFDLFVSRLKQLNNEDLEEQIYFIQSSLRTRIAEDVHSSPSSEKLDIKFDPSAYLTQDKILRQAIEIATEQQRLAILSTDSSVTWLAPQYLMEAQRFQLQSIGYNLFDGSFGVALFLATFTQVTHQARFRELSLGALQSFRQDLTEAISTDFALLDFLKKIGIGGAVGVGATAYVLTRLSQFLEEPTLLEDATQVASLITFELIAADKKFDIIFGTAEAVLGLLTLHNISPDLEVLEKAILCGNHLLNNRVTSESGYKAWATVDGKLLTGFSHGAAGIAYALLRLYQATGETRFKEAAEEAIAYERSVFIPELNNWPDFRQPQTKDNPKCMCSWCHGAPGIGLARVATLDILDTPEIRQDIEAAITTTLNYGLSDIDHLCCGNMGRVEFLFTAGRKLNRPELVDAAMKLASSVVARAEQKGHYGYGPILDFHPGFFQGASGIGYQLLRLAYPDQLPSVLLWE